MLLGYARVSTGDQNPNAQHDALTRAGVEPAHLYVDHTSGAKSSRPQWNAAYKALRDGDVLVATRLDRVGRSTTHLVGLLDELGARGVAFRFLEQGIDTTTSEGRLMYRMLAAIAEFQRDLITANTREGLAAARTRGRTGGRKAKLSASQAELARSMYNETNEDGRRKHTVAEIAAILNVSRTTIYGHLDHSSVGARPRAKQPSAPPVEAPTTPDAPSTVAKLPRRPRRARVVPPPEERSPQDRDRLVRQHRRRAGAPINSLACPNCGHEPTSRPEARQQREDLAVIWLHQPAARAAISEHAYCAHCQPHVPTEPLACARCGDGPLLTGALANHASAHTDGHLPTALRRWLAEHGWQITPELICPHDT